MPVCCTAAAAADLLSGVMTSKRCLTAAIAAACLAICVAQPSNNTYPVGRTPLHCFCCSTLT